MEKTYCAFLRGINVNGISIKMEALREAFIKMGFPDAKTILATGNVIFKLEEGKSCLQELKSHSMPHAPQEQLIILESGVFWTVPKGATLSSDFGSKVLGNPKYKSKLTSRNINTIQKIYKAMMDT